ncbi:uncharacterized protein LOC114717079 isoform X1 [Neltuma alba]|uniref:uncharacterized protein LOC114717079 isoform X1 n=1 Tax=Neltuma alba TaxID=207710 RepID=UPI0010A4B0B0|nr:uncharacterized protein LOC114717079 isoform X1 [Prosopis alba]
MSVSGSLPQLEVLTITECEEVEEIMQESLEEAQNAVSDSNYLQLPFPKLRIITVKRCNKLKCLLRYVDVGMLPPLERIEVSEATQMDELCSHKSDEATASTQELGLPHLYSLKLSKLPALTHFCKGFLLNAPKLKLQEVQIDECPKLDFSSQQAASTQTTDDESSDEEQ